MLEYSFCVFIHFSKDTFQTLQASFYQSSGKKELTININLKNTKIKNPGLKMRGPNNLERPNQFIAKKEAGGMGLETKGLMLSNKSFLNWLKWEHHAVMQDRNVLLAQIRNTYIVCSVSPGCVTLSFSHFHTIKYDMALDYDLLVIYLWTSQLYFSWKFPFYYMSHFTCGFRWDNFMLISSAYFMLT